MKSPFFFVVLYLLATSSPAYAKNSGFLGFSIGYYGFHTDDEAVNFTVEYRPDSQIFLKNLKPWMGLQVTTDASLWAGGGLLYDLELSPHWHLVPGLGAGYYAKGKSDVDLGSPLEFRSQLELAYEFTNGNRIALAASHLSNANLSSHNRGAEIFGVYWQVPLGKI